jgi:tetratricopeptide (TPR) repeat protein
MWWINAEDGARIDAGLAAMAAQLCPVMAVTGTTRDAAGWATGWLQTHGEWLLVLDNVDDPADTEPLLGLLTSGHVLLTTRRDVDWQRVAVPVRLDVLDPGPAVQIITMRTGHSTSADEEAAAGIAAELGYLPLALDQAAAYIAQQRITPGAYLDRLRQHPTRMYAASGGGDAHRTIARLWDLTITAIRGKDRAAAWLLEVLAHYAPDAIPRAMLGGGQREDTDEALGLLASYSTITLTDEDVSIHRLLQAVILSRSEDAAASGRDARDTALAWLNGVIPPDPDTNVIGWPLLRSLVPHADALAGRYPRGDEPEPLSVMQNQIGMFLYSQGDYTRAQLLHESARRIAEAALGTDHPTTASMLGNLAATYTALGRPTEALPLDERALRIAQAALGANHPTTASMLANLAATYTALGRPTEALPLDERALRIAQAALGMNHPTTATRLGNLAVTYGALKRPKAALPLLERALAMAEKTLGTDHPATATWLGNLAVYYSALGQPEDALPLVERALAIAEKTLGTDHPSIATALVNLAVTYGALGRPEDALPLLERALAMAEKTLGTDHPTTEAIRQRHLAFHHSGQQEAETLPPLERALASAKKKQRHVVWHRSGQQEAETLPPLERMLASAEKRLGTDHPTTEAIRRRAAHADARQPARSSQVRTGKDRHRAQFDMPCTEVLDSLYGFLDGEVSAAETEAILTHLDECGSCLEEYALDDLTPQTVVRHIAARPFLPAIDANEMVRVRELQSTG